MKSLLNRVNLNEVWLLFQGNLCVCVCCILFLPPVIRFYDKRDAEDALDAMDGRLLDGRELRVQMARYGRPSSPYRRHSRRRRLVYGMNSGFSALDIRLYLGCYRLWTEVTPCGFSCTCCVLLVGNVGNIFSFMLYNLNVYRVFSSCPWSPKHWLPNFKERMKLCLNLLAIMAFSVVNCFSPLHC